MGKVGKLDEFVAITLSVIAKQGAEDYLPAAADFTTRQISVLDGIPAGTRPETVLQEWLVARGLVKSGVCFGVRSSCGQFVLGEMSATGIQFAELDVVGRTASPIAAPEWWTLSLSG